MPPYHGTRGDDYIDALTYGPGQSAHGQSHVFAFEGDDWIDLHFLDEPNSFSHGHHARGDTDGSIDRGVDVFNFRNINAIKNGQVIVGRLEDLDLARDKVMVDGVELDLYNLPSNMKVVEFNGAHNDPGADPQQWLLIKTDTGGYIFYALEGARVDKNSDGAANDGIHEAHFILAEELPDLNSMKTVRYIDQQNYVPPGFTPDGGVILNDNDTFPSDAVDIFAGTDGGDLMAGGLNDDRIHAGAGNDQVWGGSGHDSIVGQSGNDTLIGGTGRDTMNGSYGDDLLEGGHQNDVLEGRNGNDTLLGQQDDDFLDGGEDNDLLIGGYGNDTLMGGSGNDVLKGAQGDDILDGGDGDDNLDGGEGNDQLQTGLGNSIADGGEGDDILLGRSGNDTLIGGTGSDRMNSGYGDDLVDGGSGADVIQAGRGFDVIIGGAGDDIMTGDLNADIFVFTDGHGVDRITDFAADNNGEKLDFSGLSTMNTINKVLNSSSQSGSDVVINTGGGNQIILENVNLGDLDQNDFIF